MTESGADLTNEEMTGDKTAELFHRCDATLTNDDQDEMKEIPELCTDRERSLSLDNKIDIVDSELQLLIEYCKSSGYSSYQIRMAAKPLIEPRTKAFYSRFLYRIKRLAAYLVLASVLLTAMIYVSSKFKYTKYIYRKTLINILPYWDWTEVSQRQCLIYNPDYRENKVRLEDCSICESFDEIVRSANVNSVVISETYLRGDLPIIVGDAMTDWQSMNMTVSEMNEFFQKEVIRDYKGCLLSTNIPVRRGNHRGVLAKAASQEVHVFFAHWENCYKEAYKAFRQLYKRPYFLPPMVELDDSNWVFVSRDYHAKIYKEIDTRARMLMIAQLSGRFEFRLTPKYPCDSVCDPIISVLQRGDIMIVPNFLWILDYLPFSEGENIAIGVSGNFD